MTQKLIIVESPNDEAFIRLLLSHLSIKNTATSTIRPTEIEHLHNFKGSDGKPKRGKDTLPEKIEILKRDLLIRYPQLRHIAIILDIDTPKSSNGGKEKSLQLINTSFLKAFNISLDLTDTSTKVSTNVTISSETIHLEVSCFFVGDETGEGNLDVVLKKIAKYPCPECECLEIMNECVGHKTGSPMGDFTKQWVNYYLRSQASKSQLKDAEKRLHEVIIDNGEILFDLHHPFLHEIKEYLQLE